MLLADTQMILEIGLMINTTEDMTIEAQAEANLIEPEPQTEASLREAELQTEAMIETEEDTMIIQKAEVIMTDTQMTVVAMEDIQMTEVDTVGIQMIEVWEHTQMIAEKLTDTQEMIGT